MASVMLKSDPRDLRKSAQNRFSQTSSLPVRSVSLNSSFAGPQGRSPVVAISCFGSVLTTRPGSHVPQGGHGSQQSAYPIPSADLSLLDDRSTISLPGSNCEISFVPRGTFSFNPLSAASLNTFVRWRKPTTIECESVWPWMDQSNARPKSGRSLQKPEYQQGRMVL